VPKPGDLIKVRSPEKHTDPIGVVIWVNKQYPPSCAVLIDGKRSIYDTRIVEVISESQ